MNYTNREFDSRRNGLGVILCPELKEKLLQVNRGTDGVTLLKIMVEKVVLNVICPYAPQAGYEEQKKEGF